MIFYSKYFEAVKSVMGNVSSDIALSLSEFLSAFSSCIVLCSFSFIASHFSWLPDSIKELETSAMSLQEAVGMMEDVTEYQTCTRFSGRCSLH